MIEYPPVHMATKLTSTARLRIKTASASLPTVKATAIDASSDSRASAMNRCMFA
ncbi:hypothetical protein QN372_10885 [Undibacterium sp. RTI2.1]|uniref:hypothetical protein n=1 Tax=unclassified Undibacterium TaxID=2630295 RepID=UPI002AB40C25|nr:MULTISPECIES: hypothetical protein [unclassified Undibacterium]MDY7538565.1 hypothetical protein [Undibacterium sp. 5I1]MEB0031254.1 hypothetical protein [Undibacterium sp. RTI2.1]MEB0116354.1 hypothetical protein [Undibacterium sp. RTI2.2]MEB0232167.1 hypothetical protein [Undibacterium sp. 10I3]